MGARAGQGRIFLVLGALAASTLAGVGYVAVLAIGGPPSARSLTPAHQAAAPSRAASSPATVTAVTEQPTASRGISPDGRTGGATVGSTVASTGGSPGGSPAAQAGNATAGRSASPSSVIIATWRLPRAAASRPATTAAGSTVSNWRHTFGAERTTAAWRSRGAAGFDADIIALQGVSDMTDARRLFPARTHHVLLSRQVLATPTRRDGIVALVIARRAGIKTVGIRHFLPVAGDVETAAALAVRFKARGRLFWVVTVDRPQRAVRATVHAWLREVAATGTPVIFGGELPDDLLPNGTDIRRPATSCASGAPVLAATGTGPVGGLLDSQPTPAPPVRFASVSIAGQQRPCAVVGRLEVPASAHRQHAERRDLGDRVDLRAPGAPREPADRP